MNELSCIVARLMQYFDIQSYGEDPAFKKYLPTAYDEIKFDWKSYFENGFSNYFNGLMIKGNEEVGSIFASTFLSNHVLEKFIERSKPGSMLIVHHPIDMKCGDPRGEWGSGFTAPDLELLQKIKKSGRTIFSCHLPLDIHQNISTGRAIAQALEAKIVDFFCHEEHGYSGLICSIKKETDTDSIIDNLKDIFNIPYVDFEGKKITNAKKIAVLAGGGDVIDYMNEAESKGAQIYITGEVHHHINTEYGKMRYNKMMEYVKTTNMSLIGVSHAASEFLVFKNQFSDFIQKEFASELFLIEESNWWR